jgi:small subunit ribosomal protein S16
LAVRIRLTRVGATKRPSYRVVAIDSRRPRDGRSLEILGFYDPLTNPVTVRIDTERVNAWIAKGARPSDTVGKLIRIAAEGPRAVAVVEKAPAKPKAAAKPRARKAQPKAEAAEATEDAAASEASAADETAVEAPASDEAAAADQAPVTDEAAATDEATPTDEAPSAEAPAMDESASEAEAAKVEE